MKRLLTALALTIGLVLGASATTHAAPANTTHHATVEHATRADTGTHVETPTRALHNQDNNSYFGCAATRPNSAYSIDHSWWDGLYPDLVTGRCMAHNIYTGLQACWRLTWWYPGKPGQYFQGTGYAYGDCWFSPHQSVTTVLLTAVIDHRDQYALAA
jgi:hypothetical protein